MKIPIDLNFYISIDLIYKNSHWFDSYEFLLIWSVWIPIDFIHIYISIELIHMLSYWFDAYEFISVGL